MKKIFLILMLISCTLPVFAQNTEQIYDELLDPKVYTDNNNSIFKLGIYKKGEYQYIPISDELIDENFISNSSNFGIKKNRKSLMIYFLKNLSTQQKSEKFSLKTNTILQKNKYLYKYNSHIN